VIFKRAELLAKAEFDVQEERCEVCWKAYSLLDVCLRYLHSFAFESRNFYFYGNIELGVIVVCVIANCWTLYFKIQTSPGKGNC